MQPSVHRKILNAFASHAFLIAFGLFFFLPFYWLVSTSPKADAEVFAMPPVWVPKTPLRGNVERSVACL